MNEKIRKNLNCSSALFLPEGGQKVGSFTPQLFKYMWLEQEGIATLFER
jgi:hypothetical protein